MRKEEERICVRNEGRVQNAGPPCTGRQHAGTAVGILRRHVDFAKRRRAYMCTQRGARTECWPPTGRQHAGTAVGIPRRHVRHGSHLALLYPKSCSFVIPAAKNCPTNWNTKSFPPPPENHYYTREKWRSSSKSKGEN